MYYERGEVSWWYILNVTYLLSNFPFPHIFVCVCIYTNEIGYCTGLRRIYSSDLRRLHILPISIPVPAYGVSILPAYGVSKKLIQFRHAPTFSYMEIGKVWRRRRSEE